MRWGNVLALVAVLSIIGLLGFGLTRDANELPSPLVGNAAPLFDLTELDGDTAVSLASLEGRPVVINFWASWCLACRQEHPYLVRAWDRYRDQGVVLLGVVYQDTPANARRYLVEHGGGWPQVMDPGSRTALDYGVYGVPETFFIDRSGTISHKHVGPVDEMVMTTEVGKLLASAPDGAGGPDSVEVER